MTPLGPHTPSRRSGVRPTSTAIPQPSGHEIQERERLELCGMAPDPDADFDAEMRARDRIADHYLTERAA